MPDGPSRGALQRGETVTLEGGRIGARREVVGPARRGRVVVLTGDTAPTASVVEAATGADVLVHEATFLADERARARETEHSTAGEAALVAQEAGVALLALTHVSARYAGSEVAAEALQLFPRTVVPRDFDLIDVPLPERGPPELVPRGGRRSRRRRCRVQRMSELVQVAVTGSVDEAEELQALLTAAGIEATLEGAVDEHPDEHGDVPVRLLVAADELDAARDAIEALTEPDDQFPG